MAAEVLLQRESVREREEIICRGDPVGRPFQVSGFKWWLAKRGFIFLELDYVQCYTSSMRSHRPAVQFIALVVFFCAPGIMSDGKESNQWGETALGLRCSLSAKSTQWTIDTAGIVTVTIENTTSDPIVYPKASAGLDLGNKYWGPVKLARQCEHLGANETFPLSISPHETLTYIIDLSKLKWNKNISSIWPFQSWKSIAKPGTYKLAIDVHFGTNTIPNWLRSNEISITVH